MDYFENRKLSVAQYAVIAVHLLVFLTNTTTTCIETSVGGSFGMSIGSSIGLGGSEELGESEFTFTYTGKVDRSIIKYPPTALDTLTSTVQILDVPFIDQRTLYPTGCESVSTTTVLQYYGIDITVDDFIDNHLAKAELEIIGYKKGNAILSSLHPNEAFIGNPKSSSGLGCYENTITNAIDSVLEEKNLTEYFRVESHRDLTQEDLQNYIDKDVPIIVWATQNMVPSVEGISWYLTGTDTLFQYMKNEHCLVIIGYDNENFYFNDSLVGRIAYPKTLFLERYTQMGTRAVTVEYVG
jgi:uncharacterized protein YvpB